MDANEILTLVVREAVQNSTRAAKHAKPFRCKVGVCPLEMAIVNYQPSLAGNTIYGVCFIILLFMQLFFGIRKKTWTYMTALCLGIFGEIVGYGGRLMLHQNPFDMNNFLVYLVPLTIAPALLTGGIYLCLSRVIVAVGADYSRIKPKMYTYIFIGCDLLSLVLQSIGGAIASMAGSNKNRSDFGVHIMIAGLISQIISMVIFFVLWGDFAIRARKAKSAGNLTGQAPLYENIRANSSFRWFQWSLFIATLLIFIRSVYRVAELWGGFDSHLANDEVTFMIFEGPMIIIAVMMLTAFHPGRIFDDLWIAAGKGYRFYKHGDTGAMQKIEMIDRDF